MHSFIQVTTYHGGQKAVINVNQIQRVSEGPKSGPVVIQFGEKDSITVSESYETVLNAITIATKTQIIVVEENSNSDDAENNEPGVGGVIFYP